MRINRTLATAGLTVAALGLAGTASIASAAPSSTSTVAAVSPQGGKKVSVAPPESGGRSLAFAQDGRDNFHP
ncbi:hypothetical protein [Streptomyces sp. NPDC059918]|uniref:hypothetical protein n=1 Tax=unclassified Streptomyces TaxID=2593676 RepID=UPI0036684E1E